MSEAERIEKERVEKVLKELKELDRKYEAKYGCKLGRDPWQGDG